MKMVARIPAGSRPPLTLASLLGLGLATLVTGEGLAGDFASCSTIPGDRERLACYDRAAALVAKPAPPGTVATAASQPMTLPTPPVPTRPQDGASPEPAVAGAEKPVSSLLKRAWALSPVSARYVINLYRTYFILLGLLWVNPN
jgi:hypothetical protein